MGRPKLGAPFGKRVTVRDHVVSEAGDVQYLTPMAVLVKPGGSLTVYTRYETILAVSATDARGLRRLSSRKSVVAEGTPLDFAPPSGADFGLLIEQLEPRHPLARKTPI